jgi:MFS family permease
MSVAPGKRETWIAVIGGALLMLATLPGRTQGLGLITEPLLADLRMTRESYAQINLWATLLGALACLPVGAWLDRRGPRGLTLVLLPALAAVVWVMSQYPSPPHASVVMHLFILVLLTRALGQSALSVLSIGVAGSAFRQGKGGAAAAYTVLLSIFFMVAFGVLGAVIRDAGWRTAWSGIAVSLLLLMPLAFLFPKRLLKASQETSEGGLTLAQCLRQPLFWIYSSGIALFAGVQSGIGLFNEALLAERGFDRETYHHFLAGTAIISLIGQGLGGGTRWLPLRRWLGLALIAQGIALSAFQFITGKTQLWLLAVLMGISAGIITVAFFAIWAESFGKRHLGRIMGAAQTISVLASATGPLLLERGAAFTGSFAKSLMIAAPVSVLLGLLSMFLKPARHA